MKKHRPKQLYIPEHVLNDVSGIHMDTFGEYAVHQI